MMMYDLHLLSLASSFFQKKEYVYSPVPWLVDEASVRATLDPTEKDPWHCAGGYLIGSGEQGFIQILPTIAPNSRLCTLTPCFRDEVEDEFHQRWFVKLELFSNIVTEAEFGYMLCSCTEFYSSLGCLPKQVKLGEMLVDITINDIEVGSYGVREVGDVKFIYGTGIALPRFNQARSRNI